MIITNHALTHLPVFTESGHKLGHILTIELDTDTHAVRKYSVGKLVGTSMYLVTPAQVKSITDEKVVVDDAVLKVGKPLLEKITPPIDPASPGAMPS